MYLSLLFADNDQCVQKSYVRLLKALLNWCACFEKYAKITRDQNNNDDNEKKDEKKIEP